MASELIFSFEVSNGFEYFSLAWRKNRFLNHKLILFEFRLFSRKSMKPPFAASIECSRSKNRSAISISLSNHKFYVSKFGFITRAVIFRPQCLTIDPKKFFSFYSLFSVLLPFPSLPPTPHFLSYDFSSLRTSFPATSFRVPFCLTKFCWLFVHVKL